MAIITKGTVEKGTQASFTLSKSQLAAHSLVAADAYFSDNTNWANVILEYKSDVGAQSKRVIFDATQATPTADFFASETARDVFEIQRLVIIDHDGGKFILPRANLTTAEFDLDLATVLNYIDYNITNGPSVEPDGGVVGNSNSDTDTAKSTSNQTISGDYKYTFNFTDTDAVTSFAVGISTSSAADNLTGFSGLAVSGGLLIVWFNFSNTGISVAIPSGNIEFIMERTVTTLVYKLNGSTIHTQNSDTQTPVIPMVRPKLGTISSSYQD